MKHYLILLILLFSSAVCAETSWEYIEEDEFCYIQSVPIKTIIPDGKSRGDNYILIYRMHKNTELFIQITAGFKYKSQDSVQVTIDDVKYNFYTDEDTAWAKDDKKTIVAMKKGLKFQTTGVSSKGTTVVDFYTLKGITTAINRLINDC